MKKICIVGGCGHVGIPLGLAFASRNFNVTLLDINKNAIDAINAGKLPFIEDGAQEILEKHIGKNLLASNDENIINDQDIVVFVTGTPVDEHHTPKIKEVLNVIQHYSHLLNKNQLIVLRSTIFPGTTEVVDYMLSSLGEQKPMLSFCPERIVQGKGIEEIFNLPQLVSATTEEAYAAAAELFSHIAPKIIRLEPKEAELAKLMTNSWRYLEFAIANQFYMMIEAEGLDFYKIYDAMRADYPRARNFPKPGLAAGPCLFKDTMQLSVFNKNNFTLGQSGMHVNEGLPDFLVESLERKMGSLKGKNIALLGMSFKPDNDDIREALSFKIKKRLEFKMANVLTCDPYIKNMTPLEEALSKADGIILGMPHSAYKNVVPKVPYVDCWNCWGPK
ncbi:MAG: nucleotide sugar dehydrogenase [Endomicrobium sp.]|jgi:UDP-N-acetyl-D-mannosaminuronic acid dehydrogenase|nr:nucleotide sugar dehydrogenase [Endomicrobium sp.]